MTTYDTVEMKADPTVIIHAAPPTRTWHRITLGVIVVIAAFLNFYQLGQGGYPNLYYAAAIKSMLMSWHNFFFVSFDPGGFVTIDKPPLGFWLQATSAKLFGLSPWSVLLPQALAGLIAVPLLYHLVRRTFGPVPGLLAALALALTPITVVMSRNNSIDSVLTFTILLAAWPILKATETGRLRWLLLGAALVGLAFNVKTLEAYMVVPALALVYVLGSSIRWPTRILHLVLALVVMVVISLSWMTIVDLTPASQRPYVGSSSTNSELELALGYNGVQRITGNMFGRGGGGGDPRNNNSATQSNAASGQATGGSGQANSTPSGQAANGSGQAAGGPGQAGSSSGQAASGPGQPGGGQGQGGGPGGGGGGVFNTGQPGLFRLFNGELGGQASWLLAFALASILLLAWQIRKRLPLDRRGQSLVLWGVWLLTMGAVFSVSGFFHTYYLIIIGPAVSALFGIGAVAFWQEYRQQGWRGWLLSVALLGAVAVQVYMLAAGYPEWSSILTPVLIALGLVAACVLAVLRWQSLRSSSEGETNITGATMTKAGGTLAFFRRAAISVGLLALLIVPGVWDGISLAEGSANSGVPAAGPRQMSGFGGGGGGMPGFGNRNGGGNPPGINSNTSGNTASRNTSANRMPFMGGGDSGNPALQQYLLAHQGKVKFLVAVASSMEAESFIMNTGKPVMALGGFSGSDPILTTDALARLVDNGTVRFFLLGGGGFGGRGGGSASSWVTTHCSTVPTSAWQTGSTNTMNNAQGGGQLYDCAKHS